jgi:release factor glutamine methyltransferase
MASLHERLLEARHAFERARIPAEEAAIDAEVLARHVLGWDRAALIVRGREPAPDGFNDAFDSLVQRRLQREPVAMIVGRREFWGLEFEVTRDVLVPRPDTEFVVEAAIELAGTRAVRIVDIGTGSGCIAVSLAVALPAATLVAADISPAALAVARRNAERHGVRDRMTFVQSDLLEGVTGIADLIVSNPPYIASADVRSLPPEVVNYEPHVALFGGEDGLVAIRRLFAAASAHLAPGGHLVIEFGYAQESDVAALATATGWHVVEVRRDLAQIPRVIALRR